ncbi:hypothetical protein ZPAH1_orf00083 [Aeromonas phage ZPAH1]|nr:hypothetical protein ASwh1_35 [Aeromonas phage Aswh_1]QQG33845.1 hypothetical protein ZPAH1_orf00083 [Aeromonas phage ZPAH1]
MYIFDPLFIVMTLLVAAAAYVYNRNPFAWVIGSLIFSPVIVGIVLLIAGKNHES